MFHSEFNPSSENASHLLQIWIVPDRAGHQPGYQQKRFEEERKRGRLCLVASPNGRNGSVTIHQDVELYSALLDGDERIGFESGAGRKVWIQVAAGSVEANGVRVSQGDGAAFADGREIVLHSGQEAEILLFDMTAQ